MSDTLLWSADSEDVVPVPSNGREAAIRAILDDLEEEPAAEHVERERERTRLRWAEGT